MNNVLRDDMDMPTACSGDAEAGFQPDPSYVEGEDCFAWVITRAFNQYKDLWEDGKQDPNLKLADSTYDL